MPPSSTPPDQGEQPSSPPGKFGRAEEHLEEAMKLGTLIAIAALAMAMTLGGAVTPADAGDKKKRAHQQGAGKVHFRLDKDPRKARTTLRNLQSLEDQFRGNKLTKRQHDVKHALSGEVRRRSQSYTVGEILGEKRGAEAILNIWGLAGRESGH
jgi:hypothetical protein